MDDLINLINQWNLNRVPLFALSLPNENGEFCGVMRFCYQDAGQKVATKCVRVSSTATTNDVIKTLVEKFRADIRMLSIPEYGLYEIHENGEERKLEDDERPLLVQLNWHKDDREGRFLMKKIDEKSSLPATDPEANNFQRKLSKKEKKEKKKREKREKSKEDGLAQKLYTELPETCFTRSISNPEAVMRRRRKQKLEKKLQQLQENGPDSGGTLRIFGECLNKDVPYKTLLLSTQDTAAYVVEQILDKYRDIDKNLRDETKKVEQSQNYCLVLVIDPSNSSTLKLGDESHQDGLIQYILNDDDCPLAIKQHHNPANGQLTFSIRKRPQNNSTQPSPLPQPSPSLSQLASQPQLSPQSQPQLSPQPPSQPSPQSQLSQQSHLSQHSQLSLQPQLPSQPQIPPQLPPQMQMPPSQQHSPKLQIPPHLQHHPGSMSQLPQQIQITTQHQHQPQPSPQHRFNPPPPPPQQQFHPPPLPPQLSYVPHSQVPPPYHHSPQMDNAHRIYDNLHGVARSAKFVSEPMLVNHNIPPPSPSPMPMANSYMNPPVIIRLKKNGSSLGLSIVAARSLRTGRIGIYIKAIVKGGTADLDGRLQPGDQLLSVNNQSLIDIPQEVAAKLMTQTDVIVTLVVAKQAAYHHGLSPFLTDVPQSRVSSNATPTPAQQIQYMAPPPVPTINNNQHPQQQQQHQYLLQQQQLQQHHHQQHLHQQQLQQQQIQQLHLQQLQQQQQQQQHQQAQQQQQLHQQQLHQQQQQLQLQHLAHHQMQHNVHQPQHVQYINAPPVVTNDLNQHQQLPQLPPALPQQQQLQQQQQQQIQWTNTMKQQPPPRLMKTATVNNTNLNTNSNPNIDSNSNSDNTNTVKRQSYSPSPSPSPSFTLKDMIKVLEMDEENDSNNPNKDYNPNVIGAHEVYKDPREKIAAEKMKDQPQKVTIQGPEKLTFKEKMKLFAEEAN